MRQQARRLVNVLPREQKIILFEHCLDQRFGERLADRAAVLVVNNAARLVKHFPSAFPGLVSEIGVLQVERRQERVEAAQLEEFAAVESAGAAAAIEAGKQVVDF